MKKLLFISLFMLLAVNAFAADYYVRTDGHDTNCNGTANASAASAPNCAWLTVDKCIEDGAGATDTCNIGDGTYTTTGDYSLKFPLGVSLTAINQTTPPSVKIVPGGNLGRSSTAALVQLISASLSQSGNQSISYIEFDGVDTYEADQGIRIENRNSVYIHHNYIHHFTWTVSGSPGTWDIRAWALLVKSTAVDPNAQWNTVFAQNWVMTMPSDPVSDFRFYNNVVDNCGGSGDEDNEVNQAIIPFHIKDSTIHDNTVDGSHSHAEIFATTPAYWDTVTFYNNYMITGSNGRAPGTNNTNWCLEVWVNKDVSVYNNKLVNSGMSVTYGTGNKIYNNYVDRLNTTAPRGDGIEAMGQHNLELHHNFVLGKANYYDLSGIGVGPNNNNAPNNSTGVVWVWDNVIKNAGYYGLMLDTSTTDSQTFTYNVFNNTIDNITAYGTVWAVRSIGDPTATITINLKNNIIINSEVAYSEDAYTPTKNFANNLLWNNITNGFVPDPDYTTEPTFISGSYAPSSGSAYQVNKGIDLSGESVVVTNALSSNTVWGTGNALPVVITQGPSGDRDIGAYEFGTVISAPYPTSLVSYSSNPQNVEMGATSNINSNCKYESTATAACGTDTYATLSTAFEDGQGTTSHGTTISQNAGVSTTFAVICQDTTDSIDSNCLEITVAVAAASGAPQPAPVTAVGGGNVSTSGQGNVTIGQ